MTNRSNPVWQMAYAAEFTRQLSGNEHLRRYAADKAKGVADAAVESLGEPEAQPVSPAQPQPHNEPGEPPAIAYALWDPREREFCEVYEDRKTAHALAVNGLGVVEYWRVQHKKPPESIDGHDCSCGIWVYSDDPKEQCRDCKAGLEPPTQTAAEAEAELRSNGVDVDGFLARLSQRVREKREQKPAKPQPRDESRDVWVWCNGRMNVMFYDDYRCASMSDGERYAPYAQLEAALGKCSGCGGDNCSRMWREQKKCCPDCKCEVTDSVLLDAILEAYEKHGESVLCDSIRNAIAERSKR